MPDKPLASDPNLDLTGFLYRSLEFLRKELSYSGRYKPNSDEQRPNVLSDADQLRAERGDPNPRRAHNKLTRHHRPRQPQQVPAYQAPAPAQQASAPAGNPWQQAFPGAQRKFEYKQPIPGPGITLSVPSDANTPGSYTTQLGFSAGTQTGSPDLQSPTFNPELLGIGSQPAGSAGGSARQPQAQDGYLSRISDASLEVLEHFGAEAPALLNKYACAVEDALIEQVQRGNSHEPDA